MWATRALAASTLVLVGAYFCFRAVAARCSGANCDIYIPFSVLLPISVLVVGAVTGVVATAGAHRNRRWFAVLLAATVVGVLGPIGTLVIFRDEPDSFIFVATALVVFLPSLVLFYSYLERRSPAGSSS